MCNSTVSSRWLSPLRGRVVPLHNLSPSVIYPHFLLWSTVFNTFCSSPGRMVISFSGSPAFLHRLLSQTSFIPVHKHKLLSTLRYCHTKKTVLYLWRAAPMNLEKMPSLCLLLPQHMQSHRRSQCGHYSIMAIHINHSTARCRFSVVQHLHHDQTSHRTELLKSLQGTDQIFKLTCTPVLPWSP